MAFDYHTEYQKYKRYYVDLNRFYKGHKEVQVYLGLAFAIITSSMFILFAVRPTLVTIASLQSDIRSQEDINKRLEQKIENLRLAYANYSNIQPRLSVLDESGPTNINLASFLRQIELMSQESGTEIKNLNFESSPIGKNKAQAQKSPVEKEVTEFTIIARGGYGALNTFLKNLENLRRIVIIKSFGFSSPEADNADSLTLSISAGLIHLPINGLPTPTPELAQ